MEVESEVEVVGLKNGPAHPHKSSVRPHETRCEK